MRRTPRHARGVRDAPLAADADAAQTPFDLAWSLNEVVSRKGMCQALDRWGGAGIEPVSFELEDETDIAALVAYQLTREGYRVETVGSGADALTAVRREQGGRDPAACGIRRAFARRPPPGGWASAHGHGSHRATIDGHEVQLTPAEFRLLETLVERRLRAKLGDAGELVETVRGFGYRFRPE